VRNTAPNPARRRRAAEVVTLPDVKLPEWHREKSPARQCVVCEREFPARNFAKTCSPECSRNLWLANRRKYYAANSEKILAQQRKRQRPIIRQCVVCGKEFDNRKGAKTCSPEHLKEYRRVCGHEYYLVNREKWVVRDREQRAKRSPKIRQCVVCGKDVVVVSGKENTCSPKCKAERRRAMERARYRSEQRVLKTK
jgi:predicted nucleic acid-binding Zn ribbon protein